MRRFFSILIIAAVLLSMVGCDKAIKMLVKDKGAW